MRSLALVLLPAVALAGDPKPGADSMFDEMPGLGNEPRFTLSFFDALTGRPIAGAKVAFDDLVEETDVGGVVKFPMPEDLRPDEDKRIASFSHPKYISSAIEVRFMLESVWFGRYSISPKLPPGKIRVVLDWTQEPLDLDAHLVKHGSYHISYHDTKKWEDLAELDRDDQDGFGPETITVHRLDPAARYSYFVHDYSGRDRKDSDGLERSRAHVKVFADDKLLHQIAAPRGKGRVWKVFEVVRGEVKIDGAVVDQPPR